MLKNVTVGEYTFTIQSVDLEIYLHKDSDFIDINTAYAEGYLNDDDIEAIYYYSKTNQGTKSETAAAATESVIPKEFPPLTPLSAEEQMKIKEDFDIFKADDEGK